MNKEELLFYPFHPTDEKTHLIETTIMPILEQDKPFSVEKIYNDLNDNLNINLKTYEDKRFEVEGYAIYVGPDVHHKPSIQLSNEKNGRCYALTIFPNTDFYNKVSLGDRVIIRANYLVLSNLFGVVMKNSEIIKVNK